MFTKFDKHILPYIKQESIVHGQIQVTLFSTYLFNNENDNSVSEPCVSIDYVFSHVSFMGIPLILFLQAFTTISDKQIYALWYFIIFLISSLDSHEEYVSYDVDSLFRSIPLDETVDFTLDEIYFGKKFEPFCKKSAFKKLINKLHKGCASLVNGRLMKQIDW